MGVNSSTKYTVWVDGVRKSGTPATVCPGSTTGTNFCKSS
jgi:hypothetical protein